MIIYESKIGESLTFGFLFNEAFDMSRLESVTVCLGSRTYAHTIIDQMIRCELKSEDTNKLNGTLKLTLEIDDVNLGIKKLFSGDIKFNVTNAQGSNASINTGYDFTVPIIINEQAITVGDVMYNYVIGPPAEIPSDVVRDANYVHTDNNFTNTLKNKLDSITAIFTSELKTAYDGAVAWVNSAGQNINTWLGISTGGNASKLLNQQGDWVEIQTAGGGSAAASIFLSNVDSDIAGYKTLSYTPDMAETVKTIVANNNTVAGEAYLFTQPIDLDFFPIGRIDFGAYLSVSSTSNTSYILVDFFIRSANGTEQLIDTFTSESLENTSLSQLIGARIHSLGEPIDNLGRFGCRVKFQTTRATNTTLTYIVGDGRAMFFKLPIATAHKELRRKNEELAFQHLDATSEKTTPIAADSLGLWDSITNSFKRVSNSNFITFLSGTFATIAQLATKQATLVSGSNIRPVNGNSLLGSSDLVLTTTGATVVGNTGPSETSVMHQKATTNELRLRVPALSLKNGANLFNKNTITNNAYINSGNGLVVINQTGWLCSDFIPVLPSTNYSAIRNVRDRAYYDINFTYISGESTNTGSITTPAGCYYIRFSHYNTPVADIMFNLGSVKLPIEPFYSSLSYNESVYINLPEKIYAVVGDTLQLFYRGIIKAWDPYQYDIVINCSKGAWYPRYFEYTPIAGDIGTATLQIKVKDNNGNLLGTKTCSLVTTAAVKAPTSEVKALFVGDSLTNARVYATELNRRLTATGGTPAGNGYANINLVGRKKISGTSNGVEGNSGWSWVDYTTVGRKAFTFSITAPSIMPAVEAVYQDANSKLYTMWWDYSTVSVKMLVNDNSSTPPMSGTLTKVSGTGDATITYSSAVQSSGNPFWNDTTNALDFPLYVNKWCGGSISVVYIMMTWNGQTGNKTDFTSFIDALTLLVANIRGNYTSCKIKIAGVQVSDLRGGVRVDGYPAENTYTDTYGLSVTALNLNDWYQNWAKQNSAYEFVNISSQVDSEYNMPYIEKQVNTRNSSVTEKIGTNDVHPSAAGYNQIADVFYRNFISNYCQ